jgi:hypothetical protein
MTRLRNASPVWIVAVGLFVVGDLVTTTVGLDIAGVEESHPVGELFVGEPLLMLALKLGVMLLAYGFSMLAPDRFAWLFPAALAVLGAFLTAWNLVVILSA